MTKNAGGRPTDYTEELAEKICDRIRSAESLNSICKTPGLPTKKTVYNWLRVHSAFKDAYLDAKEMSAHADADKIQHIAEQVLSGEIEPPQAQAATKCLTWLAAKKKPKSYGDLIKLSGNDTGPIKTEVSLVSEILKQIDGSTRSK